MRSFVAAVLFIVAGAGLASAQRSGRGHPGIAGGHPGVSVHVGGAIARPGIPYRTYGSPTGFGNILSPGLGTLPPMSTFAGRLGATISGTPGYGGSFGRRRGGGGVVWPMPYPVYVADPYGYEQPQPPNVTIVMPPVQPQPSAPPVTIQQYFTEGATPQVREYTPEGEEITRQTPESSGNVRTYRAPAAKPAAPPDDDRIMFMIALKDSSVYTAAAYWVEGETLHYITTHGEHNQVSVDLVDRATSDKLNRGRKVPFRLPPSKG